MKTCVKCGETKSPAEFWKQKGGKDGLRARCRTCLYAEYQGWYDKNRDKVSASNAADYAARKDYHRARARKYQKANPEIFRRHARDRKVMLKRATPLWVDVDAIKAIYDKAAALGMAVDHIYPLKHKLFSGLHVPWNLQLLPKGENSRKSNRHFPPLEAIAPPHSSGYVRQ